MNRNRLIILILIPTHILIFNKIGIYSILNGSKYLQDFDAYYALAQDVINNINPYTVNHMQTLGPPLTIFPYLPLAFFSKNVGQIIFTLGSLISVYLTCYLLAKKYFPKSIIFSFSVLSTLFLTAFPARFTLEMGQIGLYLTFLLTIFLTNKDEKLRGLVLSVIISTRLFFIAIYMALIKKRWIIKFSFFILILIFIDSLIFADIKWYIFYFKERFVHLLLTATDPMGLEYYNQSLKSTVFRVGLGDYYFYILIPAVVASGYYLYKSQDVLAAIIISILLSPISWQHYYAVLFPIFVIMFSKTKKNVKYSLVFFAALFLWWIEFPFLQSAPRNIISGFIASHYFISGILLVYLTINFGKAKIKI
jgi:hypothetical protein